MSALDLTTCVQNISDSRDPRVAQCGKAATVVVTEARSARAAEITGSPTHEHHVCPSCAAVLTQDRRFTILNATLTRAVEVPSVSGRGGHTVPAGTRVLATAEEGDRFYVSGPSVKATVYVERAAFVLDSDIRPVTSRVYFAVPSHYTIGAEFDTFAEAAAHATASIKPHDFTAEDGKTRYSRAFIDIRQQDEDGDRPLQRFEILHTGLVVTHTREVRS